MSLGLRTVCVQTVYWLSLSQKETSKCGYNHKWCKLLIKKKISKSDLQLFPELELSDIFARVTLMYASCRQRPLCTISNESHHGLNLYTGK